MNFRSIYKSDTRSAKLKSNIVLSAIIKAFDTIIYLLLVPITLGYLNAYEYGIWLTINSILMWINSFDIGLGNGLRNKLAMSEAEGNKEKGRIYVSTTFYILVIIMFFICITISLVIHIIDWYKLLNVDVEVVKNLQEVVLVSFFFFCLNFVFKFIGNVYQALQLPAVNNLITLGGHLVSLIIIYILTKLIPGNLFFVALAYSAALPIVYMICYPITFYKLFPYLAPSIRLFRRDCLKDLLSLGVLFFVIQIMGIVLFSMSNLIISNWYGPDQVTPYNIAYRYFNVIPIFFNLILMPVWSATTDAFTKKDYFWIEKSKRRLSTILFIIAVTIVIMILVSDFVYKLWVGDSVHVPYEMSLFMGVYVFIIQYSLCYSYFLNGMGKLRLQTINVVLVALLFIPVCHIISHYYGVLGILIGMCLVNLSGAILNRIQFSKILNNTATGIWGK